MLMYMNKYRFSSEYTITWCTAGFCTRPCAVFFLHAPLQNKFDQHLVSDHRYADNIQLYVGYNPSDPQSRYDALGGIQACILDISRWMSGNQLKLNHEKTELLNVMTPYQLRTYGLCSVVIDDVVVQPSKSVRTLGVLFDEHMSMHPQVTQVVRTCNYHLRNIGKIW